MKKIGIIVTKMGDTAGVSEAYVKLMQQYGEVRFISVDQKPEEMKLDLIVLPGGADLDPTFYNEGKFVAGNESSNPYNSHFYRNSFEAWRNAGVPMLGICLGMQCLNVMLGGRLTPDGPNHRLEYGTHPVVAYSKTLGIKNILRPVPVKMHVNSRHHQFVQINQLADGLTPIAFGTLNDSYLKEDKDVEKSLGAISKTGDPEILEHIYKKDFKKISSYLSHVEAFIHVNEKIGGIQWHPEDLFRGFDRGDNLTHKMIQWLLDGNIGGVGILAPRDAPKVMQDMTL